jgi:hypothetical protein
MQTSLEASLLVEPASRSLNCQKTIDHSVTPAALSDKSSYKQQSTREGRRGESLASGARAAAKRAAERRAAERREENSQAPRSALTFFAVHHAVSLVPAPHASRR